MSRKYNKFSPEFREEAVRLVVDNTRPIAQVARELGVHEDTLGNWVNQYRVTHADDEPALTPAERIQLAQAQREVRELRMENEFLKKPQRTSPGIGGKRLVRVHRLVPDRYCEVRLPRQEDVPLAGRVVLGVL